jgi:hypothetical protein
VQHHGPGDGHDCLDSLLGVVIMMMRANAGKTDCLAEGFQMRAEGLGGEG